MKRILQIFSLLMVTTLIMVTAGMTKDTHLYAKKELNSPNYQEGLEKPEAKQNNEKDKNKNEEQNPEEKLETEDGIQVPIEPGSPYSQEDVPEIEYSPDNFIPKPVNAVASSTKPINPRMIAEWEPMKGAVVRYPLGIPLEVVKLITEESNIYVLVSQEFRNEAEQNFANFGIDITKVTFIDAVTNTYWARDYLPWWIMEGDNDNRHLGIVDMNFYKYRRYDNYIPKIFADFLNLKEYYDVNAVVQGGNIMTDGLGVGVSTDKVFDQNQKLNKKEYVDLVKGYTGFSEYHIIPDTTGTYIKHIDCWAKFISPTKVLIRRVPKEHKQYKETEKAVEFFKGIKNGRGEPFEIFRVDTPNDEPYVNHLILNDRVFVPIMGNENDETALNQIRSAYGNGYRVYGILSAQSNPWYDTDSLHCRVNAVPDYTQIKN